MAVILHEKLDVSYLYRKMYHKLNNYKLLYNDNIIYKRSII